MTTQDEGASSYTINVNEDMIASGTTDTFGGIDNDGNVFYVGMAEIGKNACPTPSPSTSSSPSLSTLPTLTSCIEGESPLILELQTDSFSSDTSWDVFDVNKGSKVLSGPKPGSTYLSNSFNFIHECLPCGAYVFTMRDSYGDGLDKSGSFVVTVGGEMVLSSSSQEFGSETSVNFEGGADCPELTPLPSPSASCSEDQISFEITLLTTNPTLQTHWSIIDVKTQNIAAYGPEAATAYNVNTLCF